MATLLLEKSTLLYVLLLVEQNSLMLRPPFLRVRTLVWPYYVDSALRALVGVGQPSGSKGQGEGSDLINVILTGRVAEMK